MAFTENTQTLTTRTWFANQVSRSIIASSPALLDDKKIFLVDGTTMTLASEKELQTAFPPASNQNTTFYFV